MRHYEHANQSHCVACPGRDTLLLLLLLLLQVGVRELVVDGGVLLGGFLVDTAMAALLKRQMRQLQTLVLARCPDLDISHLKDAVTRRLAPHIVVRRDCGGVDEAQVVGLAQGLGARYGVVMEMAGPAPGEYADKSYSYAVDD
jgi:hypothetical protein